MTRADITAKSDALEAEAKQLRKQSHELYMAELKAKPLAERLVYAAYSRCPCGAGLAYDPASELSIHGYWDCSAILLGSADKSVQHTGQLPFAFYEIKSEGQPSANGATTRPAKPA